MKLLNARITNYRSFEDSGRSRIEPDVTCVVRKSRSGQAAPPLGLVRLGPAEKSTVFDEITDSPTYTPRGCKHRAGRELVPIFVASRLGQPQIDMVEERPEAAVIGGPEFTLTRDYRDNTRYWDI